jgi:7-carboxy-7-deazaguanine synthase
MVINEIYPSIQGESSYMGIPMVFIRLAYCNLRCRWCDTAYAFEDGKEMSIDAILEAVAAYKLTHVEVTGGEPLIQKETPELLQRLIDAEYTVLLETGGSRDIQVVPDGVVRIIDIKCPGSRESERNLWENIEHLNPSDQLKFVLADRRDYDWAREILQRHSLADKAEVLFSPVYGEMDPKDLTRWILDDTLPVRVQVQLHKFIWPAEERGV